MGRKFASSKQRACFIVDDFGIRWQELDEDLLFEGFFRVLNLCRFAKSRRFALRQAQGRHQNDRDGRSGRP